MIGRASWEVAVFFLMWLGALIHALLVPPGRAWRLQLTSLTLFCLASVAILAFDPTAGLIASWSHGDRARLTVDLALLICGTAALVLADFVKALWNSARGNRPAGKAS